ncbi:MAG: hypothetical protein MZV70_49075 [Desulfobacterales bacterium]|nr:hypothetical protein [Desulfobacterales bacterium]
MLRGLRCGASEPAASLPRRVIGRLPGADLRRHRRARVSVRRSRPRLCLRGKPAVSRQRRKSRRRHRKVNRLKPFEPTEKVKADQALDFPADI